jgi:acyl dehydratase
LPEILSQLVGDSEEMNLDILRVVHAEQEMWWRESILPDDEIITEAKIENIEQHSNNEILDIKINCKRKAVTLVEMRYRLLLRGKKKSEKASRKPTNETTKSAKMIGQKTIQVTEDQGQRYAEASGDHNPIHISDEIAQSVGLPRAILQGLCTMAFASQAIVDALLDGDSSRLRYMKVRFSNPVFMDDTLTTEIYDFGMNDGKLKEVSFQTKNASDIPVLIHGLARYTE